MLTPLDTKIVDPLPSIGAELHGLIDAMRKVAWLNLYFGLINICFYVTGFNPNISVVVSGGVSVLMYLLVRMKISYITGSKNWVEVSVTVACGLYLPIFTLLLAFLNLVGIIGS